MQSHYCKSTPALITAALNCSVTHQLGLPAPLRCYASDFSLLLQRHLANLFNFLHSFFLSAPSPLQGLTVIQHSAAFQEDSHSQAVAAAALASLVPAWLAAGRSSHALWGSLLGALPGLPAPRRRRLLEALRKALPEVGFWCCCCTCCLYRYLLCAVLVECAWCMCV